ncbi:MAG TPA: hypothetical protein VLD62_11535, partial [Acidimicrobiia bacterium]|nr:hypothetical protein [Acidimicrobiia bacterium]
RAHLVRWADASRSHHFQRAKESIRAMLSEVDHDRYWRPQVLLFSADEERRERLLHLATWLEGRSGLTQAVTIIEGEGALGRKTREQAEDALRRQIERLALDVHARAVLAPNGLEALSTVAQSFGIGPLEANTALFGLPDEWPAHESYVEALQAVARFRKNVFAVTTDEARWAALHGVDRRLRRIDVWWNDGDSGRLGLLTAYLFTRTPSWSQATLHLVAPIGADQDRATATASLAEMCDTYRIPATPVTVGGPEEMLEHSATASLVLFPMRIRGGTLTDQFGRDLGTVIDDLPMAAGLVAGKHLDLAAGPESGLPGRLAEAERAKIEASERAVTLQRQLRKLMREIADLRGVAADTRHRSDRSRLAAAERRAEAIGKRVMSAQARAESAQEEIDRILGGSA